MKEMHPVLIEKLTCYLQLILVFASALTLACPSDCSCKWKGGKQSVECLNRGLRTFPGPMDPGTQVLDLSGNSFETLPPDHFMRLGLINLQKIYLSKCKLTHVSPRTFRGLSNLVDLDLSNNALTGVPSGAFPDCQGLMRLILSANPITSLQRNAFISLESLTTLEISNTGLELVEKGAFDGLLSLEWLKLNGNKLKRISGLGSLPLGLKGIWLEDNPWECDCRLLELRLWLTKRNVSNSVEPRCLTPSRLTNSSLKDVSTDNFACVPQLSPTTMYQKIGEGKNVSLLCKVISVPEATIEWWFNGQPVSNSSLNMLIETSSVSLPTISLPMSTDNNGAYSHAVGESSSGKSGSGGGGGGGTSNNNNNNIYETMINSASGVTGMERKSELLILNATGEENGTFLCLAKNPAGIATANFTLKVLIRSETETYLEHSVTSFVQFYPNIIVIVVSTASAVGAVIILFILIFIICKCSQLCRKSRASGSSSSRTNAKGSNHPSSRSLKESKDATTCAGKLNRHLSEASNLTTTTKSNGSVFLLSSSSELGISDSNPDLIEGVKRVEGDGHEINFSNFSNSTIYAPSESSSAANPATLEPFHPSVAYAVDYGLPTKTYNVGTLVRRSQSQYSQASGQSLSTNQTAIMSIPDNYDLAKYPKEYISPTPMNLCPSQVYSSQMSLPPPSPNPNQGTAAIYASHMHQHHQQGTNQFYPQAYVVAPDGTLLTFNPTSSEEYYISMAMGQLHGSMLGPGGSNPSLPMADTRHSLNPTTANCTCTTIPEQSEEEKAEAQETESIIMSQAKNDTSSYPNPITHDLMIESQDKSDTRSSVDQISEATNSPSVHHKKNSSETGVVARLQRQLKAQTNESPDEGYEDESAEGTEI